MEARERGKQAVALAAAGQWSEALNHAHACHQQAPAGTTLSVWSLHVLACIYADAGVPRKARQFAREYLDQAESFPELERYTPFVLHAVASSHYQQHRWGQAVAWYTRSMTEFARQGKTSKAAEITHNLAWAMVRSGRPEAARRFLAPREQFPAESVYLHDGALAAICSAEGLHQAAIACGRRALSATDRRSFDIADAAEVALIIARSLKVLGESETASAYIEHAANLCALQQWDTVVRLLLNERAGGGDWQDESAAAARGSADPRDGSCYCTGVA